MSKSFYLGNEYFSRALTLTGERENSSTGVNVPAPIPALCSKRVFSSEWVEGEAIDKVRDMLQLKQDLPLSY
eukprot:1152517-Pelagomonas_calceolata.AAC.4